MADLLDPNNTMYQQETMMLRPNESIDSYMSRVGIKPDGPATLPPPDLSQYNTNQTTLSSPYNATTLQGASTPTPTLPTPTAPQIQEQYTASLQQNLLTSRQTLESEYKRQQEELQKRIEASEAQMASLTASQEENALKNMAELSSPFRETKETAERDRLKVEENYFANQESIKEMEALFTQLQTGINQAKEIAAPQSIMGGKIAQAKEDAYARIGVLEAVMAARNKQIGVAENLIDRTITAIKADRQDQLSYYETLFNFYESQKDVEGKKLISLRSDQKQYIEAQIGLLENDLKKADESVEYIKSLMIDPQTANMIAQAGVKLTDSPEVVNQKLAAFTLKQEQADLINQMAMKGYQFIPASIASTKPSTQLTSVQTSTGQTMSFWSPEPITSTSSSGSTSTRSSSSSSSTYSTNPYKFTSTQLNKGAGAAAIPLADFMGLIPDDQNFFIQNATEIENMKEDIKTSILEDGVDPSQIEAQISNDTTLPDSVKDTLVRYLKQIAAQKPAEEEGFFSRVINFFR